MSIEQAVSDFRRIFADISSQIGEVGKITQEDVERLDGRYADQFNAVAESVREALPEIWKRVCELYSGDERSAAICMAIPTADKDGKSFTDIALASEYGRKWVNDHFDFILNG